MADNTVEILVDARAAAAEADIDVLKQKLRDIGRMVETARAKVDVPKEDEAKLARLQASLARVNRTVHGKVSIEGAARAEAELLGVDLAMDRLNDKSAKGSVVTRALGSAFSGLGSSLGGLVGSIPLVGSAIAAVAGEGWVAVAAFAALAVGVGVLLTSLGPLVAGLAVAGAGFAAFAAGAVGEIKKVLAAHQKLAAAQAAYEKATTKAGRASALKAEKEATDGLTASEKTLLGMLGQLGAQFSKLQKAVQPEVVKAFGTALDIIKKLMPTLTPLAVAAGKALNGFLTHIDNWISSSSGKKFIAWLQNDGPKAIDTFGKALWNITAAVGQVLYWWDRLGNDLVKFGASTAAPILKALSVIVGGFHVLTDAVLTAVGIIVNGMAKAFGWVPGVGAKLKTSAADFNTWKNSVDSVFNHAQGTLNNWQSNMEKLPKIVKLQGNIVDLQSKVATALRALANPNLTKTRRAKLEALVADALAKIAALKAQIASLQGKTVTVSVVTVHSTVYSPNNPLLSGKKKASGGIIGAAAGGGDRSGLTWVGEQGPELIDLPAGTRVHSNPDSMRMAAHGGGGGDTYNINVQVHPGTAPAEVGRQIAYYLAEHKKRGGMIYRPAGF